jgi:branched-chain amino acid transport system permease protein
MNVIPSRFAGALFAIAAVLILLLWLPAWGGSFYVHFATRIMVYAMAALALDLLLGYGGLASFGHAAFFGAGAYAVGILTVQGFDQALIAWPAAILAATLLAILFGTLALRTSGIYFLMITLAFGQMTYYFFESLRAYGGDDGFSIPHRGRFYGLIDISNPVVFYYLVGACLALVLFALYRLVNSRFGAVLQAGRDNERRLAALGVFLFPYRLAAFAISGAITGLAGVLSANTDLYVTPHTSSWLMSGELLIMVILGGSGTLLGPVAGAVAYLALEQVLSAYTEHWMVIFGPLLVLRVLLFRKGFIQAFSWARSAP